MQLGSKQFSPGLWPTVITTGLLLMLLFLGFWQLDRADQKLTALRHMLQRSNEAPLKNLETDIGIDTLLWRKTILSGSFSQTHTYLLDNQVVKSEAGYFVYSLFELDNGNTVLVNRGWVVASADRKQIPELDTPHGKLKISGVIKAPPATGLLLAENTDEQLAQGLYRLQHISPEDINKQHQLTLLPYIVRLDAESPAGYAREWRQPGSGKEKHLGYAFQWFAMAAALLIIFLAVNLKKKTDGNNEP
jgi:surfeit locus 1 family protein